jgi:TonB family protein
MRLFAPSSRLAQWSFRVTLLALFIPCIAVAHAEGRHVERRVAPVYPELAKRMHITGAVRINAMVSTDGSVTQATATNGNKMLISAAEEAVRKWKFVQAETPTSEIVEINFVENGN